MEQVLHLGGLEERHKWADHKELLKWVNNPVGYMAKDPYTQGLKAQFGSHDDCIS